MPVSFEGLDYERYLFKPVDNCEGGGLWADVYLPDTPPKNGHTGWPVGELWLTPQEKDSCS